MKSVEIDELATALWAKKITADAFLRATGRHWRRYAAELYKRWRKRLPQAVEYADVEQVFLMQVCINVPAWDPARGMSISQFVLYASYKRTQREIHKMRGARIHGNEGKNASHVEQSFSKLAAKRARGDDAGDFNPEDLVPIFATQDARAAIRELLSDALHDASTVREAFIMLALRECGGDPDDAAVKLFESFSARVECEFRDVEQARRAVEGSVREVVSQYITAA